MILGFGVKLGIVAVVVTVMMGQRVECAYSTSIEVLNNCMLVSHAYECSCMQISSKLMYLCTARKRTTHA